MSISYPVSFPTAETVTLYSNVKAGTLYQNRTECGKAEWVLQGFCFRVALGEPGEAQAAGVLVLTDEDKVHIKALADELQSAKFDDDGSVEALAKDRPILRNLFETMLPLLLKLLAEYAM